MPIKVEDLNSNGFEEKIIEFLRNNKGQAFTFSEIHKALSESSKESLNPEFILKSLKSLLQIDETLKEMANKNKLNVKTVERQIIQKENYYFI